MSEDQRFWVTLWGMVAVVVLGALFMSLHHWRSLVQGYLDAGYHEATIQGSNYAVWLPNEETKELKGATK